MEVNMSGANEQEPVPNSQNQGEVIAPQQMSLSDLVRAEEQGLDLNRLLFVKYLVVNKRLTDDITANTEEVLEMNPNQVPIASETEATNPSQFDVLTKKEQARLSFIKWAVITKRLDGDTTVVEEITASQPDEIEQNQTPDHETVVYDVHQNTQPMHIDGEAFLSQKELSRLRFVRWELQREMIGDDEPRNIRGILGNQNTHTQIDKKAA